MRVAGAFWDPVALSYLGNQELNRKFARSDRHYALLKIAMRLTYLGKDFFAGESFSEQEKEEIFDLISKVKDELLPSSAGLGETETVFLGKQLGWLEHLWQRLTVRLMN